MTDTQQQDQSAQNAPQSPVQPPQQPMALSPEQINVIKQSLINRLENAYKGFLSAILAIPSKDKARQTAIDFFDTGFFWFEAAIKGCTLPLIPMSVAPQQPQPPAADQAPAQTTSQPDAPVSDSASADAQQSNQ